MCSMIVLIQPLGCHTLINDSRHCNGIYCDLQKVFDTVNHSVDPYILIINGIRGTVFNWFKNYLTNRKQYVAIDNVSSTISKVDCGVSQGSVLGPLLFLIYMNDIQYYI